VPKQANTPKQSMSRPFIKPNSSQRKPIKQGPVNSAMADALAKWKSKA
jgi:hypothetical protein